MDRAFDLDRAVAEAEAREAQPAGKSEIRQMAERMAAERREKLRRADSLVRREPFATPGPAASIGSAPPSAPAGGKPEMKSVQLLRALKAQGEPIGVPGLHALLPEIESTSIAAYMASFSARRWAIRTGSRRFYVYRIGPKGAQYLKTFHPPD